MGAMKLPEDRELPLTLTPGEVLVDELDATDKYRVDAFTARGGMGEVYRGTRLSDGILVAVKCVRGELVTNPTILLRSRFEASACRQIHHSNVVCVHGTGVRSNRVPWLAMQWLEGYTLQEILDQIGKIPLRWAIQIVRDLCRGLHAIHPYAIHRDIKPSNVHLSLDGVTRALDLGVAKSKEPNVHLTTTGTVVGTLPFMSPEQLDNLTPVDVRSDLWAATVLLYVLITGVHPFGDARFASPGNKIVLGYRILRDPHRPLTSVLKGSAREGLNERETAEQLAAEPWLDQIIDRGLAKDPERRHRSAEELAQVLTAALDFLQTKTGRAEPLSGLIERLRGGESPGVAEPPPRPAVAEPPPRAIWIPPRTTEPMPPPVAPAPPTTEPMPAPTAAARPQRAPGMVAPEVTHEHDALDDVADHAARLAFAPAQTALPPSPAGESTAQDDEDLPRPRDSDVRVRRAPLPQPAPRLALPAISPVAATPAIAAVAPAIAPSDRGDPRRRVMGAPSAATIAGTSVAASPEPGGRLPGPPLGAGLHAAVLLTAEAAGSPPQRRTGGAGRWLRTRGIFGAPRWVYALAAIGAVITSAGAVYSRAAWRSARERTAPTAATIPAQPKPPERATRSRR